MAGSGPLKVAIIGCGNIAAPYAKNVKEHPDQVQIVGAYDILPDRTAAFVRDFGGKAYESYDAVLADPEVECVINLTIHQAHVEVSTKALQAGKHVHTEKPIAIDPAEAKALVALAKKKKVRFSAAPTTFLGEAQQTAWKLIRDGQLGTVRVIYAEMNWGRIETWHPNPAPFYEVGAMYDVAVYPLTILTSIFGPVAKATGFGKVVMPERTVKATGAPFTVTTPDWLCGLLEFESGPICRLTACFYVANGKQTGIEFHGDAASLHLAESPNFASALQTRTFGTKEWSDVPLVRPPYAGVDWSRGITELHDAIRTDRPQRATGAQAAHVVEVLAAIHKSVKTGRSFAIRSRFTPPQPMDWAR